MSKSRNWEKSEAGKSYHRIYRAKNKVQMNKRSLNWWHKNKEKRGISKKYRFSTYKKSAKKRNLAFKLTFDYFVLLIEGACVYCGEFAPRERLNGIDRKVNTSGYTKRNCVSCCITCNRMKFRMSPDMFIKWCTKIVKNHKLPE